MDRSAEEGKYLRASFNGYSIPPRVGGPWHIWRAQSVRRVARSAYRLCRKRMQLLCNLADWRTVACRPRHVTAFEGGLASEPGRMGGATGAEAGLAPPDESQIQNRT